MNWIEFECLIMDIAEAEGCDNSKSLTNLSQKLHDHLENALLDYATDNGIEDYETVFF